MQKNIVFLSFAIAFAFSACADKEELYNQCYYSVYNDDNRSAEQKQKDDSQCFKLAQLEEKDDLERAILHYARACKVNTPDSACEHLAKSVAELAKRGRGMVFKECQDNESGSSCERYDVEEFFSKLCYGSWEYNKNACFEYQKAKLIREKQFNEYFSAWKFIREFDEICKQNLPKACIERDKLIEKYVAIYVQKSKEENFDYISSLDTFCRFEGVDSRIAKRACAGRDELIAMHEKECDENNATSCSVLVSNFYEFLTKDRKRYYDFGKDTYESQADKIYPRKFENAAKKACDLGEISGCEYLAYFYYSYKPKSNYTLARQYGKKVALMLTDTYKRKGFLHGDEIAPLETLAHLESKTDDEANTKKQFVLDYFKVGCEDLQNAEVCLSFGYFYDERKEGEEIDNFGMRELISQKQALHYYDKACALGEGCGGLGRIYLFGKIVGGEKVKKDLTKAKHYFAKDCESFCRNGYESCKKNHWSCNITRMSLKELKKLDECDFDRDSDGCEGVDD